MRDNSNYLVCLDLERGEGKLLWKIDAEAVDAAFAGSPLVKDGRAYAVVRKGRPQMLTEVICLDAETKQRRWERPVCASVPNMGQGEGPASGELLTAGDHAVFLTTGNGSVSAIEAEGVPCGGLSLTRADRLRARRRPEPAAEFRLVSSPIIFCSPRHAISRA